MSAALTHADGLDPELIPVAEIAECVSTVLRREGKTVLSYGGGGGYTPLRELIGEWFGVAPERVVLTNGWLQGCALLGRRLCAGRNAVVEYPADERSQMALLQGGVVMSSVTVDRDGMRTDEFRQLLTEYLRPPLVYTVPTFHNPTGTTMPLERRRAIVDLVRGQNVLQTEQIAVLEDDSYGLTRFEGESLPALFDLSGKSTIYSSSFSATIGPGLRVAWFIAPEPLARGLIADATASTISPVQLGQAAVCEFIRRGLFEEQVARVRAGLRARRDAALAALADHFPDATWVPPQGGLFVWVELPPDLDTRELISAADVPEASPGTAFAWTANCLRLSYGSVPAERIVASIERLAAARERLSG